MSLTRLKLWPKQKSVIEIFSRLVVSVVVIISPIAHCVGPQYWPQIRHVFSDAKGSRQVFRNIDAPIGNIFQAIKSGLNQHKLQEDHLCTVLVLKLKCDGSGNPSDQMSRIIDLSTIKILQGRPNLPSPYL